MIINDSSIVEVTSVCYDETAKADAYKIEGGFFYADW